MRVGREHGVRVVAQASGDDVHRDALRERERGGRVAEHVQRPRGDARRLPQLAQKKDRLIVRRAANQRRRAELRALYPGIEEA